MNDKTDILKPIKREFIVNVSEYFNDGTYNQGTVNYDLYSQEGIKQLYSFVEKLEQQDKDYVVTNIQTDDNWAWYDEITNVDDMVFIARKLKEMTDFEYLAFKTIVLERIQEPLDVAKHILSNGIEVKKAHHNDDEIEFWEEFTLLSQQFVIPYQF